MKIAICSGKGGTGKTTMSLNLAWTLGSSEEFKQAVRILDCDVEEPNCHLFLRCNYGSSRPVAADKPELDMGRCIGCGRCANKCRYNAIAMVKGTPLIFNDLCHSCGVCAAVCPHNAIRLEPAIIGEIMIDETHVPFSFAFGRLNVGESQSPVIISQLQTLALSDGLTIIDGPPGTGCSAVKTIAAADLVMLVTEPSPFGAHDLSLALNLCHELAKPCVVFINRSDENDALIENLAAKHQTTIAGRIPFRREYASSCSEGRILAAEFPHLRSEIFASFAKMTAEARIPARQVPVVTDVPESIPAPPDSPRKSDHYQEITILSGKGGTGKTTVTAALAAMAESRVFADCDVDAANLKLVLGGRTLFTDQVNLGSLAIIDPFKCSKCGRCETACRFNAISQDNATRQYNVNELLCEGCGLCKEICPCKAISERRAETGRLMLSESIRGSLIHAELATAAENSGKLVSMVRDLAFSITDQQKKDWLICDGPPGTACPAIASITGSDRILLVTEPSIAALHDLRRIIQLIRHFGLIPEIIINKADINAVVTRRIYEMAASDGYKILGEIPFDESVKEAIKAGVPVTELDNGPASQALFEIWNKIKETRNENRHSRC